MSTEQTNSLMVFGLELLAGAIVALAAFLLRLYRREGIQDRALKRLEDDNALHALLAPRMQRVEMIMGIDSSAGGGMIGAFEQMGETIQNAAVERRQQNEQLLKEIRSVGDKVQDAKLTLGERIQALELTTVRK